ncbi:MAG: cysteine peptidase family C39 domain-containing protein [Syntrophotaleaceae bacterium]
MSLFGEGGAFQRWRAASLLSLCLVAACNPLRAPSGSIEGAAGRVIAGVPFYAQQGRYDCGPAALASLLAQRGASVSLAQIRAATYTPSLQGSLLPDMENYARGLGYGTRSGRGDLALLRRMIDAGTPVLIPLEMGRWALTRPHYLVVFGYDDRDFIVHAGKQPEMTIAAAELDRRWQKLNRLYLYLE